MTDHPIPFAALDSKVGVLGSTGSGKSYTAIGQCERLLDAGRQVIIVDPTGAYVGLRTAFPIPIFGGKTGDVPIDEADGARVAKLIVDFGLSAIIDVSLLLKESHAAARRFMAPFVAALKNAPTAPRYLVIDEADEFMPENASGAVTQLFGDLKWIVRRGRIEGWRMLMVTQRPQDIAKSVLTQCETLVAHRLPSPQDRKAVEEWVKGHAEPGQAKEVLQSLASLETGEAWVWSPRHNVLVRTKMPANRSEDSSRTPDADSPREAVAFKPVDVGAIRAALATTADPDLVEKSHKGAQLASEIDAIAKLQLELADVRQQLADERDERTIEVATGQRQLDELMNMIGRARRELDAALKDRIPAQGGGGPSVEQGQTEGGAATTSPPRAAARPSAAAKAPTAIAKSSGGGNAPSGAPSPAALAIADLLDRVNPARLTWTQAATMTGRKASGGNFNAARKWLRESERIVEDGDLIRSAQPAREGMTRVQAIELWKSVLTNPAPRMIDAFVDRGGLTKEELGSAIGAQPRGGNFNNGLSQLRRNWLLYEYGSGTLRLAEPLPGEGDA